MLNLNTSFIVGTDPVVILIDRTGLNTKRKSYAITNTSLAGQKISIFIGELAVADKGIPLYVGGSIDRTLIENPQQEIFTAVSSAAGGILSVQEESE
jgi:hypothetical protein